jgi:hypothetical protein
MAVQRVRSDVDRTRLFLGAVFMAIATWLIAWIAILVFQAGRIRVAGLVYLAILGGLFYLGLRLLRPKDVFDIDVERREYVVFRNGKRAGKGPLDALGPLEVRRMVRSIGTDGNSKTRVTYIVRSAVHAEVDLYLAGSAARARRKMEKMARAWGLPCRSLGGAVRAADQIDMPLHQRLRDDADARREMPLRPEWGIFIEPLSLGYAMRSTLRSWAPLGTSAALLAIMVFFGARSSTLEFVGQVRASQDLLYQVLLALFGVVALAFLWMVVAGVRDAFFPGTVRITDRGVSYRFSRMAFREIEELTTTHPIELIGDRRTLTLGETFCQPAAAETVAHELQRLIIEVAEANPHAR